MTVAVYLSIESDVRMDLQLPLDEFPYSIPSQSTHPDILVPEDIRYSSSGWRSEFTDSTNFYPRGLKQ